MELRNYIGLVLIVIGTSLMPVGWMYSQIIAFVGFLFLVLGAIIFYTQRAIRKEEAQELRYGSSQRGHDLPADIHGHSGWSRGGRSESYESEVSEQGGGSD